MNTYQQKLIPALFLATLLPFASGVKADPVYSENSITLDTALKLATAANDHCRKAGFNSTVTVLDQRGQMKVQLHSDGAFPHTVITSYRKALTDIVSLPRREKYKI